MVQSSGPAEDMREYVPCYGPAVNTTALSVDPSQYHTVQNYVSDFTCVSDGLIEYTLDE